MARIRLLLILLTVLTAAAGCSSDGEKAAAFYKKGVASFEQNDFKVAEIQLKNAIQLDPQFVAARLKLGETFLQLGNAPAAYNEYSKVIEIDQSNGEALLRLASLHLLAGDLGKSREYAEKALLLSPDRIEALYVLAALDDKQGHFDASAASYSRIIALDNQQWKAMVGKAAVLAKQGRVEEAELSLRQALDLNPSEVMTWAALARLYLSKNDPAGAEKTFSDGLRINPESSDIKVMQGRFFAQQNRTDEAERAFLDAIELAPGNIAAQLAAAHFYESLSDYEQAEKIYHRAVAAHQQDAALIGDAARFFFRAQQLEEAERYIVQALELRPNFLPALMLKGEILAAGRKWNDAIAVFDQVLAADATLYQAHYLKGLALMGKGDLSVARQMLGKAIDLNSKDPRPLLLRAEIHLRQGNLAEAERDSRTVVKSLPESYQANLVLGRVLMRYGKPAEAKVLFDKLTQLDSKNPQGYFQLGVVQRLEQDNEAAMASLEKALDLNPKLLDVFSQIIAIEANNKRYRAALARCDRQQAKLEGSSFHEAYILNLKARLYLLQDQEKAAEKAFKKAIEAYPEFSPPYFGLADLYISRNDTERAIQQYQSMLEKNPDMVGAHMLLGTLYEAQGRHDLSETHYREVLRIDRTFAPAANNLAYQLADRGGDLDEALKLARTAKEKLPEDPSVMDTLGWIYFKKGLYESAVAELSDSVEKLPNSASVHYHLGLAYAAKEDSHQAKRHLAKALELDDKFDGAAEAKRVLDSL